MLSAAVSHPTIEAKSGPAQSGSSRAVLVVEDEDSVAVLLVRQFQRMGWRVLYAPDGAQARQRIAEGDGVTLAFVDCGLPDVSGAELCAEIRAAIPGVPVLLTSGRDQSALAAALAEEGPAAFLAKPYFPIDLEVRLGELLAAAA